MATLFDLELQDSNNLIYSLMGKSSNKNLVTDIQECMKKVSLRDEEVKSAYRVFNAKPETLSVLSDKDRDAVLNYWLKKKGVIDLMYKKGYDTYEIYS